MKNQRIWLGILVMVMILVFGMTVLGCKEEEEDETDPALNGTWVRIVYYGGNEYEGDRIKLDNGKFEMYSYKGTYTTKDGKITGKATHVTDKNGKWYTKDEYKAYLKQAYGNTYSAAQIDAMIDELFKSQTMTYSIKGNKLTISGGDLAGEYIKK
jgi:hypothetical protein